MQYRTRDISSINLATLQLEDLRSSQPVTRKALCAMLSKKVNWTRVFGVALCVAVILLFVYLIYLGVQLVTWVLASYSTWWPALVKAAPENHQWLQNVRRENLPVIELARDIGVIVSVLSIAGAFLSLMAGSLNSKDETAHRRNMERIVYAHALAVFAAVVYFIST